MRPSSPILLALALVLVLGAAARGQTAYVLSRDAGGGSLVAGAAWLPDAAATTGSLAPSLFALDMPGYFAASIAATGTPMPPVAHEGGLAIDQLTGIVYATDGSSFLTQDAHSAYSGLAAPAGAAALPLPGAPSGDLTGLAVDPDSGLLWICGAASFQARSATFPYPAAAPVIPLPPFAGVAGATGLGFDPSTGHLWATNVGGATIEFTTTGALVSSHPGLPGPHGPVRGLDVNPSQGVGALPPYPGQLPGFRVCVTDGDHVFDALPPYASLPVLVAVSSHCRGLALCADPTVMPGSWHAASATYRWNADPIFGGAAPVAGLARPGVNGPPPSANFATLSGAPPAVGVSVLVDLLPLTFASGGLVVEDDVLWINPVSAGSVIAFDVAVTDGSGDAAIFIPLDPAPAGLQFALQWMIPDPGALLGVDFSDAINVKVCYR